MSTGKGWIKASDLFGMFKMVGSQLKSRNPMLVCKFISVSNNKAYYATDYLPDSKAFSCFSENNRQERKRIFTHWFRRYKWPNGERFVRDECFMPCRREELGRE